MKLADEILAGPSFEEAPEGVPRRGSAIVAKRKEDVFAGGGPAAVQKFREKLRPSRKLIGALSIS